MRFITRVLNFNNRSVQTLNILKEFEGQKVSIKHKFFILGGGFGSVFLQISFQNNCKKKFQSFKKTESLWGGGGGYVFFSLK